MRHKQMTAWLIRKGVAMENLIALGILLGLVGAAVLCIWKEKKKGTRCIGCPAAGCCRKNGCGKTKGQETSTNHKKHFI